MRIETACPCCGHAIAISMAIAPVAAPPAPIAEQWLASGEIAQRLGLSKSRIGQICRMIDDPSLARKPCGRWQINASRLGDFARVSRVSRVSGAVAGAFDWADGAGKEFFP